MSNTERIGKGILGIFGIITIILAILALVGFKFALYGVIAAVILFIAGYLFGVICAIIYICVNFVIEAFRGH